MARRKGPARKRIGLIVTVVAAVLLFYVLANPTLNTMFFGVNELQCSPAETGVLTCDAVGAGRVDAQGEVGFQIDSGAAKLYVDDFETVIQPVLERDKPEVREFFTRNSLCQGGTERRYNSEALLDTCTYFYSCPEKDAYVAKWKSSVLAIDAGENTNRYCRGGLVIQADPREGWYLPLSTPKLARDHFQNQLIIVEGTLVADEGRAGLAPEPFRTYGFCNLYGGVCTIKVPVAESLPSQYSLTADMSSIKLYLKVDGYSEQDVCEDFGFGIWQDGVCERELIVGEDEMVIDGRDNSTDSTDPTDSATNTTTGSGSSGTGNTTGSTGNSTIPETEVDLDSDSTLLSKDLDVFQIVLFLGVLVLFVAIVWVTVSRRR